MPNLTLNQIPKATDGTHVQDSLISDNGTTVTVAGPLAVTGAITPSTPLAVANGGTGSATAVAALTALGAAPLANPSFTGNATVAGALTVGGNANPTLAIFSSNYTALMAPDVAAGGSGVYVGNAANAFSFYRQGEHDFQDRTAATTFCKFSSGGTSNVSGAWLVISDASMKEGPSGQAAFLPYTRGLDAIVALNPVHYRYRAGVHGTEPSRPLFGLLADEVRPHVPEIVGSTTASLEDKSVEIDTLEPGLLVFALINAVKTLEARLAALEGKPAGTPRTR